MLYGENLFGVVDRDEDLRIVDLGRSPEMKVYGVPAFPGACGLLMEFYSIDLSVSGTNVSGRSLACSDPIYRAAK